MFLLSTKLEIAMQLRIFCVTENLCSTSKHACANILYSSKAEIVIISLFPCMLVAFLFSIKATCAEQQAGNCKIYFHVEHSGLCVFDA